MSSASAPDAVVVRPLTSKTETKRFGMSAAVIGIVTVCCVDVNANCV